MTLLALEFTRPPPVLIVESFVRRALEEDLGRAGDITSDFTVPAGQQNTAILVARSRGTLAGLVAAECAFRLLDQASSLEATLSDGSNAPEGGVIASIKCKARALLSAERVALNFLGHLSGIATATSNLVKAIEGTQARIVCTRKTTPGLRLLEKYAVRCGGGFNHRFGLDDAVLIKDNHIAAAGSLAAALTRVRQAAGHMVRIEVEVDTLAQLEEALSLGADLILLDNMTPADMARAVQIARGRALLEASGGVSAATVRDIAQTGVNFISSGAITHSAPSLDVSLEFAPAA